MLFDDDEQVITDKAIKFVVMLMTVLVSDGELPRADPLREVAVVSAC